MVRTYFFQIEQRKYIVDIVVFDAVEPVVVDERSVVGARQIFDNSHHIAKAAVAVECDDVGHIKRCQFFFGVGHAVRIIPPAVCRDGRNVVVRTYYFGGCKHFFHRHRAAAAVAYFVPHVPHANALIPGCLLYTSDAADEL